jgi:hypothetical protein
MSVAVHVYGARIMQRRPHFVKLEEARLAVAQEVETFVIAQAGAWSRFFQGEEAPPHRASYDVSPRSRLPAAH